MATLTETDISESRKVFNSCDLNGDGFIDTAEFRALLEQLDGDVTSAESHRSANLTSIETVKILDRCDIAGYLLKSGPTCCAISPRNLRRAFDMSLLAGPETGVPALDDPAFCEILQLLRERTGTDFASYRLPTVARRTLNRMTSVGADTFADYVQLLRHREGEAARLLEHVTIKVSRFYRHAPAFDMLRQQVLPELARQADGKPLAVWSVGCGCGEEPYTLAMLFAEAGVSCIIKATDIDPAALQRAAHGYYADAALFELPKDLRERYVVRSDGFHQVIPALREQVRFSHHDILGSRPPPGGGKFDLVCFRNVLIYLGHEVQEQALLSVRRAVRHEGYLCLGEAEWPSPAIAATLSPLAYDTHIFRAA